MKLSASAARLLPVAAMIVAAAGCGDSDSPTEETVAACRLYEDLKADSTWLEDDEIVARTATLQEVARQGATDEVLAGAEALRDAMLDDSASGTENAMESLDDACADIELAE